jgi:hypothetical protein
MSEMSMPIGKIVEEYLFYDNGTFLSQVGLA